MLLTEPATRIKLVLLYAGALSLLSHASVSSDPPWITPSRLERFQFIAVLHSRQSIPQDHSLWRMEGCACLLSLSRNSNRPLNIWIWWPRKRHNEAGVTLLISLVPPARRQFILPPAISPWASGFFHWRNVVGAYGHVIPWWMHIAWQGSFCYKYS